MHATLVDAADLTSSSDEWVERVLAQLGCSRCVARSPAWRVLHLGQAVALTAAEYLNITRVNTVGSWLAVCRDGMLHVKCCACAVVSQVGSHLWRAPAVQSPAVTN
jgi:hypothetical protein